MAERIIGIHPEKRYNFRSNASYRQTWAFLPTQRAKAIAEQLTYLDFHEWLMENLRHASPIDPDEHDWSSLVFSVAEGFYKTDVLLYASICEAALFSVLHSVFAYDADSAHQVVRDCFRRVEDRFHKITAHSASLSLPGNVVTGNLCVRFTHESTISDSEVKFASLIRAGEAIGIYDAAFRRRVDTLREDRNTIHLAKQIERQNQRRAFDAPDRARAKKTTEDLRLALQHYVEQQPWA